MRGFTAQSDGPSGVLILSRGHFRGIWRCSDGQYSFTPGGYGAATYSAASAEEAVHYTLEHVCRDASQYQRFGVRSLPRADALDVIPALGAGIQSTTNAGASR